MCADNFNSCQCDKHHTYRFQKCVCACVRVCVRACVSVPGHGVNIPYPTHCLLVDSDGLEIFLAF